MFSDSYIARLNIIHTDHTALAYRSVEPPFTKSSSYAPAELLHHNPGAFESAPAGCIPAQQLYHVLQTAEWPCQDQTQLSLLDSGDLEKSEK